MSDIKISLFGSCVRPHLWKKLLDSLKGGKYKYEVVFSGFIDKELWEPFAAEYPEFRYIETEDLKPSQNYHIASLHCTGELIGWLADDCVFSENYIDMVYEHWKSFNNEKLVLSCRTNENGDNGDMNDHRFFGRNQNTPLMAPLGIMSRDYFWKLGGYDRRYINGQTENDVCMRVWADGGVVKIYNDVCVTIDHKNMHGAETNFWAGYNEDREQLQNSWCVGGYQPSPQPFFLSPKNPGEFFEYQKNPSKFWYCPIDNFEVTLKRNDAFEPFEMKDLLTKSQSRKGQWK